MRFYEPTGVDVGVTYEHGCLRHGTDSWARTSRGTKRERRRRRRPERERLPTERETTKVAAKEVAKTD